MIEISQDGYDGIQGLIYIYKKGVKNEWKGVKRMGAMDRKYYIFCENEFSGQMCINFTYCEIEFSVRSIYTCQYAYSVL